MKLKVFISSVQKEFGQARRNLKAFLLGDVVLHRFISDVFLFEEFPAKDRRADEVYLEEVKRCDIYLGIFGYEYGSEDQDGISPTEHEYDYAGKLKKTRLIYVWGTDEKRRAEKMKALIHKAGNELIRRRVEDMSTLTAEIYASLVDYLTAKGRSVSLLSIRHLATMLPQRSLPETGHMVPDIARRERAFPLAEHIDSSTAHPSEPVRTGNTYTCGDPAFRRQSSAIPSYRGDKVCPLSRHRVPPALCCSAGLWGDLFEQADQSGDFVLGKINRTVGTRAVGITAPATYELPRCYRRGHY